MPRGRDSSQQSGHRCDDHHRGHAEGPGRCVVLEGRQRAADRRGAVEVEVAHRVPGVHGQEQPHAEDADRRPRRCAERPDPGCEGAHQAEDEQGGGPAEQVAGRRAHGGRAVGEDRQRQQRGPGSDRTQLRGQAGSVHDDGGEDRGDDQWPAAEVGPPRPGRARLQRPLPAETEQVEPGEQGQPGSGVRRQRNDSSQEQRQARQERDRDRRADRRVRGAASRCSGTGATMPAPATSFRAVHAEDRLAARPGADTDAERQQGSTHQRAGPAPVQGVEPGQPGRLGGQEVDREHAGHHQPEGLGRPAQALAGEQDCDAGEQCR